MFDKYDYIRTRTDTQYLCYNNANIGGCDLFSVKSISTLNECMRYFENSYASAMSYDSLNRVCYFKIDPEYVKSEFKLVKTANFTSVIKKHNITNGLLVPTYINDLKWYKMLCRSLHFILDKVTFVTIFSSLKEAVVILEDVFPLFSTFKNIRLCVMIFDIEYTDKNKYNYQCVKKLWGLDTLQYETMVILDSDFEFINKINIGSEISRNCDNIYVNSYSITQFDKNIIDNINALFSSDLQMFPLDMFWSINKRIFNSFIKYIKELKSGYIDFFLNSDLIFFEIIMYRLFILLKYPQQLNCIDINELCIKYDRKFMWDMPLTKEEQDKYIYTIAISKCAEADNSRYLMRVHNDRK